MMLFPVVNRCGVDAAESSIKYIFVFSTPFLSCPCPAKTKGRSGDPGEPGCNPGSNRAEPLVLSNPGALSGPDPDSRVLPQGASGKPGALALGAPPEHGEEQPSGTWISLNKYPPVQLLFE